MPKINVSHLQRVLQFQAEQRRSRLAHCSASCPGRSALRVEQNFSCFTLDSKELAILFLPRLARYRFEVAINRAQCESESIYLLR